jgi:hypothetical protein
MEPAGPPTGDLIEFGGRPPDRPPRRSWRPAPLVALWWRQWPRPARIAAAALAVVVAMAAGAAVYAAARPAGAPGPAGPSAPSAAGTTSMPSTGGRSTDQAPRVLTVGHPLLGVTGRWELLARGSGVEVRIELAAGRITLTAVPELDTDGPISFTAGPGWALIRPLDVEPSYLIRDGRLAQSFATAVPSGGEALPGPSGHTVWIPDGDGAAARMDLVDVTGRSAGVSIDVPADVTGPLIADGTGYFIVPASGGAYLARRSGLRRLTTGSIAAVGPTRILAIECDATHRCGPVVIDRRDGARRTMRIAVQHPDALAGVISPDGRWAAVLGANGADAPHIYLIDLATGADRPLDVPVGATFLEGVTAWSPDSVWLFAAAADGRIEAVDPVTGRARDLGVTLPPVVQLVVRAAG